MDNLDTILETSAFIINEKQYNKLKEYFENYDGYIFHKEKGMYLVYKTETVYNLSKGKLLIYDFSKINLL
jgi:hypothetical protein